jgi:DNA-binding transcriptional LysR family regulator
MIRGYLVIVIIPLKNALGSTMDRLHAMEIFVRVVEGGSLTAAARATGIGQPAVSKTIAALENQLGVVLLLRTARLMTPTDAGHHFYDRARRILDEADEAWGSARGEGAALSGRLRVCAPVTFARLNMVPHVGQFMDQHPDLKLDLVLDDRNVDLIAENIDVALRMGSLPDSSLTAKKIGSSSRMVVASPAYLERCGIPASPAALAYHGAITYAQPVMDDEWRFQKGTTESAIRLTSRLTVTAAEGLREAIIAGIGIGIVSHWMMQQDIDAGTVTQLLTDWQLPRIDLWAVFPSGRLTSTRARVFINWFSDILASEPASI